MVGSMARARRARYAVKELYSWQTFIDDLHRQHNWVNGHENVYGIDAEDIAKVVPLPKGYTYLGEGASRIAIRASDGLVYKVSKSSVLPSDPEDHWSYTHSAGQNAAEIRAYNELKGIRVKGIRLAKTFKISRSVNVAEYVEGPHGGEWDEATKKRYNPIINQFEERCRRKGWRVSDVYYDNIKMNKYGTFVIVDIGCFYKIGEARY